MSRWLRATIAGLALSIALGAGATVAVLAATSGGDNEDRSPPSAQALVEENQERPWLGMVVSRFGGEGAIVQQVFADGPAHRAGVKRGDIINGIEGRDVRAVGDLVAALRDKEPGDEVTLTLLRDDEEMTLQVTLGEWPEPLLPPEPEGPFSELGKVEFGDILGGQFRIKDDRGDTVVIEMAVGDVASISDGELALTANDGSERTFTITDDTVMPQRPEEGDPVVVVTVGENDEARLILSSRAFHLLGMFDSLRERIRDRSMLPDVPWLDIPRFRERGLEVIPERHFHLRPESGPEPMPRPELPGDGFWPRDEDSGEY